MENILNKIIGELQNLNEKYQNIDKKIGDLDKKVDYQGDHLHQLIKIVGTTNAHLEELTGNLTDVKNDISEIKNTQQNQERVLERLSLRSISQEADINDLRRIK